MTFLKSPCPNSEDKIMKDIITSGLLGMVLVLLLCIAAPILNETEAKESIDGTEEVVHEDNPRKEIMIDSNIHTPL